MVRKEPASFANLVPVCVLGWARGQANISVQVGFGQNRVTSYSLQPSLQVCVGLDSGSEGGGAWSSARTALGVLVECTQAAAAERDGSAPGK